MAAAKVMTGARAQLMITDPNKGTGRVVGIFNNVSYGLTYVADPIFILGRYSPDELVYTSQEAVTVQASGWRVLDHGPHADASVPQLSDLLNHEYLELAIVDRNSTPPRRIAMIHSVRPISYNASYVNRAASEISVTFMGLLVDDESTSNNELPSATKLP